MRFFLIVLLPSIPFLINAQNSNVYNLDKVYQVDAEGMLKLTSSHAKVYITGSDRTDARVKIYRNLKGSLNLNTSSFAMDIQNENGSLIIKEMYNGGTINLNGSSNEEYKIEIEAPRSMWLDIHGDGDKYQISNIGGSIEMYLDDADAKLKGCDGKDFRFTFYDGDITMDKGAGRLFVKAEDGDLRISEGRFEKINATLEDGDLVLETSLSNDGEYFYDIEDGNLILTFTEGGGDFDITHDDTQIRLSDNFIPVRQDEYRTRLALKGSKANVEIRAEDAVVQLTSN